MKGICRKNQKMLHQALDRGDNPPESFVLHSKSCNGCRRLLQGLEVITAGLRQVSRRTFPEEPVTTWNESTLQQKGRKTRKMVVKVSAAAAVFLTAAVTGVLLVSRPSPGASTGGISSETSSLVENEIAASVDSILSSSFAEDLSFSVASEIIKD
jgi:hypothetical protein